MATYRSRSEIIGEMLSLLAQRHEGMKPTRLMYKSNLSHTQMKGYLQDLEEKGHLIKEKEKKGEFIKITTQGLKYLEIIRQMQEFERGWGVEEQP